MPIRIGGMASGTDYNNMVEQLMEARKVPIKQLDYKRSELDYDMGAWSKVSTLATDLTSSLDTLRSLELWRGMSVGSTSEDVATAMADVGSAEQAYTISVDHLARAQSISSSLLDTSSDLITAGYVAEGDVFDIEGQAITIEAGETLLSLRLKINEAALNMTDEDRVQASIIDNRLVLTREQTGLANITLSDTTGTALQGLGVLDGTGAILNENASGLDAEFTINGLTVSRSSNTQLDDVVEGLTINLKDAGMTVIDVKPDREAVKEAITDFIEKYNILAAQVEEFAKVELGGSDELSLTGELYGDTLLNSIKLDMRKMATQSKSPVLNATNASFDYEGQTGIMDNLSDIGIWTSGEANKLSITDAGRLDDMLENEFANVEQLFKGIYNETEIAYQDGVASDFYRYADKISSAMTGDIAKRIETMTDKYDEYGKQIAELESALEGYEQDLWDRFTRMEDALANMEYQMSYIQQTFNPTKK